MAKLFVQMSVSLDGFVEGRDGEMDWFAGGEGFDQILTATVRSIDGMIFGRKAHALGAAFWPTAGETAETREVADQIDLMNLLPKYVLTHGQADLSWQNSHVINVDSIARLKAEAQRPLALFAGAGAAQSALEAGQVDELRLIQFPVLLGGGTPLFAADGRRRALTPVEIQSFEGGPTMTRYTVGDSLLRQEA
jgi:dihydrofolate reductase